MSNPTIKKTLEVENKFSKPLKDFKKGLGDVATASDKADKKISKANKQVAKTGTSANTSAPKVEKLSRSWMGVSSAVTAFASAYTLVKGLDVAGDLAMLGAEAESVELAFERQARAVGFYGDVLTQEMAEATGNMIADVALQKNAMKALISGIDPEAMIVSMQYVSRYAQSVGADAEQLMQTVMTGLARGSADFLDDVGIQVQGSSDVVGDAVEQMKEKMMELDDIPLTNINQFKTTMENIKVELGTYFTPVLDDLVTLMGELMGTVSPEQADRMGESFSLMLTGVAKGFAVFGAGVDNTLSTINTRMNQSLLFLSSFAEGFVDIVDKAGNTWAGNVSAFFAGIDVEEGRAEMAETLAGLTSINEELANTLLEEEAGAEKRKGIWKDYILGIDEAIRKQAEFNDVVNGGGGSGGSAEDEYDWDGSRDLWRSHYRQVRAYADEYEQGEIERKDRLLEYDKMVAEESTRLRIEAMERERQQAEDLMQARFDMVEQALTTAGDVAGAFSSLSSARYNEIKREYDYEEERIKNSTMSERKKEKELEALAKKRKQAEKEQAESQAKFAKITGATNLALAIQAQVLTIIRSMAETTGGVLMRIGAGVAMAGATAGYIAQVKSANASIPNREHGGVMRKNELYEVAERNKDEVVYQSGKAYTMRSAGGRAIPNSGMGGATTVNVYNTFGAGTNADEVLEILPTAIADGLERADKQGLIQYGRMSNFQREIGN
jgi:hypothetical protein